MTKIVRAVDVGYGHTKFVSAVKGREIICESFASLAYPSARDLSGPERRTVALPINGMFYEVGPDVALAADSFRPALLHDGYVDTPEYLALLRGALHLMQLSHIDLLIVGLPVALFLTKREVLAQLATGTHPLGGGRSVTVVKTLVMAQPQGALIHHGAQSNRLEAMASELNLVVDPGSRTFDWVLARGMRFVTKKSHSVNRGMSNILHAIAQEISTAIGERYEDLDAIDLALRTGKGPVIYQKPFDIAPMLPFARTVAQQAVAAMLTRIEDPLSVKNVILAGGGAFMFQQVLKDALPKHKVHLVKEPIFANVRGYQLGGMNLLRSEGHAVEVDGHGA